MVKKIITIPTNDSKIYQQILSFMNFLLEATNQERQVLGELIKLNNEYAALDPIKRAKFILSTDMRKEMREQLDIPEKQFNGIISRLKKKELFGRAFLDEDNILHPELNFKPDSEGYEIRLSLVISKQETKPKEEPKEEPKIEPVVETKKAIVKPKAPKTKPMAKPANGVENIVGSNLDGDITLI
jgi:hypothetical protein